MAPKHHGRLGWVRDLDAEFFAHHLPYLRKRLLRMGISRADADDLVQQTFVVAQRTWERKPRGRERNWLGGIAWRLAMNLRRSKQRRWEKPMADGLDALPDDEIDLEKLLDTRRMFDKACAHLRDEDREMLFEYYVDGGSVTEIAARHGLARSTAWSRLQKLRRDAVERTKRRIRE